MSVPYLVGVMQADTAIDSILKTLSAAADLTSTAVIVTADHGGSGLGHSALTRENTTIPWICDGPGVQAGLKITRAVSIVDTAPTGLALLGVAPPPGLDGTVVTEVLAK